MKGNAGSSGLTLLEVMVAMAVMSIGLLVLMAGFSEGGRARRSAALYSRGVFLGEQLMDKTLADREFNEGSSEGTWEEAPLYHWRLEIKPRHHDQENGEPERFLELILLTSWPDGPQERSFQLETVVPSESKDVSPDTQG